MEELVLSGKDKDTYINLMISCLGHLMKEFEKKNYEEMAKFNRKLVNFFELLRYSEEPKEGDFLGIFDTIKIDPNDCGLPGYESRYLLWRLKEKDDGVERLHNEVCLIQDMVNRKYMDIFFDETTLDSLPQIPIVEKIVAIRENSEKKFIFTGDEPLWLRRLDFLNKLRSTEIPMNYECKITFLKMDGKDRYYQATLSGFDDGKKLWALYEIVFSVSPALWKSEPIDRNHKMKPDFQERLKMCFSRDPANLFIFLSGLDCIKPTLIKRCEIGPFYYQKTDNKRFVKEIFEDKKFPFLLCYRLEYLSDQDSIIQKLQGSGNAKDEATNFFASFLVPVVDKLVAGDPGSANLNAVKSQNYFVCPQELRNDLLTKVKFYDNFKVIAV